MASRATKFKPKVPDRRRGAAAAPDAKLDAAPKVEQQVKAKVEQQVKVEPQAEEQQRRFKDDAVKTEPMELDPIDDILDVKVKMEGDEVVWDVDDDVLVKQETVKQEMKDDPMDEEPVQEDGKERVIREIDVHLTPSIDPDSKLYLLQYPLRPYWRPYNLAETSEEVRVKHQYNKLEADLQVDDFSENYNADAETHLKTKKRTLTSTQGSMSTSYAIGILHGNKLYLNPLHAIVQLRPSLKYLDEAEQDRKKSIGRVESDDEADAKAETAQAKTEPVAFKVEVKKQETEKQQQTRLMSYAHIKQMEEAEPWIALQPHGLDSPVAEAIMSRMKGSDNSPISFTMRSDEYLKKLVPGRTSSAPMANAVQGGLNKEPLSRSYLDTLPLEKRILTVLARGRVHVLPFERLMKLAPADCSEEEVLNVLQRTAYLVQGCWVATSNMRYTGPITAIRDYILSLFVKNRVIERETLEELNVSKEVLREVLHPLAIQNVKTGAWEFIETTDKTFIKRHSSIAKDQLQRWTQNQPAIKAGAMAVQSSGLGSRINAAAPSKSASVLAAPDTLGKPASTMSPDTLAALPGALRDIFLKHHVCSLQFIRHSLENLAITKSQADCNPRERAAAVAAAKAPVEELTAIVNQVATCVNGVYFLSHLADPGLDPFREVVIALLRQKLQKDPSSGLQRSEIYGAAKIALGKHPPTAVYQKVMKELCYTRGATWVLKAGDGRPS